MPPEAVVQDVVTQTITQQLEMLIAFLQRPAVQAQLLALLVVLLLAYGAAWVIARLGWRWIRQSRNITRPRYRAYSARYVLPPVLMLVFSQLAITHVGTIYGATGLIEVGRTLFVILLIYFSVLVALYIIIDEKRVRPYHRRITLPLLIVLILQLVASSLFDLNTLGAVALFTMFETPITLARIVSFAFSLYLFVILAQIVRNALRATLMPRFGLEMGAASAIQTITRYLIIGLGAVVSLSSLGFDFSTLAVVFGGLSIGIGLGLQQIVSNFVSGILLLFEQSLRTGDVVNINGQMGTVQKLSIRSTTVRTFENVDLVIPNDHFLANAIQNYTRPDTSIRWEIRVGVSYDDDPVEVRRLLMEVVKNHGQVLKNPEPLVFFTDFGASSLDFVVLFWVDDLSVRFSVATDLRMMIWKAFAKHGISIPYPQQDLYIKQVPEALAQVAADADDAEGEVDDENEDDTRPKLP